MIKLVRLIAFIIGVTLLSLIGVLAIARQQAPLSHLITFEVTTAFTDTELYSVRVDGSNINHLTTGSRPAWSADGRWLSYIAEDGIYQIRLDGRQPQAQSTHNPIFQNPSWSPDGAWVVFAFGRNIYRTRLNSSEWQQLTTDDTVDAYPSWSPDGKQIAFLSDNNVVAMNLNGGQITQLTTQRVFDNPLFWSPDSTRIAAASNQGDGKNIYVIDVPQGNIQQITHHTPARSEITWSPDGEWLAFSAFDIYRVRSDGADLENLTQGDDVSYGVRWSPDGEWLIFSSFQHGKNGVYRIRPDGSALAALFDTQSGRVSGVPIWSPIINLPLKTFGIILVSLVLMGFAIRPVSIL